MGNLVSNTTTTTTTDNIKGLETVQGDPVLPPELELRIFHLVYHFVWVDDPKTAVSLTLVAQRVRVWYVAPPWFYSQE